MGGAGKRVDGKSIRRSQSFRYQRRPVDDYSSGQGRTAQDGGTSGGSFHTKLIVTEKARAGLRHTVVCLNVTGRIKERIAQSKRTCAGSLVIVVSHKWREHASSGYFLFADTMLPFFGVTFFSFFRLSCFHRTPAPSFSRSSICMRSDIHTQLVNDCLCFFFFFSFCFFGKVAFLGYHMPLTFPFVWRVRCTFSFRMTFSTF